mmetsp:Transcript_3543/g.10944  ORF Transcript_3543/g.10944 Transcript_3543/m.10944 type:complete len:258 (+) Transcript_3543:184-957(+)
MPGSLPDDEPAIYATYPLDRAFPSLLQPPAPVETIAKEARSAFHETQLARLPASIAGSAKAVDSAVVSQSRVDLVLCLPGDPDQLGDAPPPLARLNLEVRGDDLACLDAAVSRLPRDRLPTSCGAFRCPTFATTVDAYLDACREAFVDPWRRRRAVADEFRRLYAVLDFDDLDFSRLQLAVQLRDQNDAKKRIAIIDLAFGHDFPAKPPTITVRDFRGGDARELDRALYLYSPRWDPTRIATELVDHACRQVLAIAS